MKKITFTLTFILFSITCFSQDIYLAGRITGGDINSSGIDRAATINSMNGFITLDKKNLVINVYLRGKNMCIDTKVEQVTQSIHQGDYQVYDFTCKNFYEEGSFSAILKIFNNGTWSLEYAEGSVKTLYVGLKIERWLIDYKNFYKRKVHRENKINEKYFQGDSFNSL